MLWSNTQTVLPAIYSRPPEPVVSRRHKDEDPVGRLASEVLERSLGFSIDKQELDAVLRLNALDFALCGRTVTWERYVPTHGPQVPEQEVVQVESDNGIEYRDPDGQPVNAEDVQARDDGSLYTAAYDPVVYEESVTDFVNLEDFGHTPARTWGEVWYVWRKIYLTRKGLIRRFGRKIGAAIPLDGGPAKNAGEGGDGEAGRRATIYEIWDKEARCVYWISKGYSAGPLDHRADPLRLDGFFPCPKPLFGTLTNDSLIPAPDFALYQGQADEIDALTSKIGTFQEALKVVGFYAGEGKTDLNAALNAENTALVPVEDWVSFKEDGGARGKIEYWPLDQVVLALKECIALRAQLIADIFQITGIADILRGASDPDETAKAQGIKAQWGSIRIRDRQKEMARFARDVLRIKAEVIAEHFSPDTLARMTGLKIPTAAEKLEAQAMAQRAALAQQPVPPQLQAILTSPTWEDVVGLLRDNCTRQFRVDVETDSTIEPNESEEKSQTVELMTALANVVTAWGPAVQAQPMLAPMAGELIKFAVRRFRAGRELETVIDQTMDKLVQSGAGAPQGGAAQAPPEPPDKTPVEVAQTNLQREQVKQAGETERARMQFASDQADAGLRSVDQQLKGAAMARDPQPQAVAI
jgi:hypothetical protein